MVEKDSQWALEELKRRLKAGYKPKDALTEQLLQALIYLPTKTIVKETGMAKRSINRYRQEHGLQFRPPPTQKTMTPLNKRFKANMTREQYKAQCRMMRLQRQSVESKQASITIIPPNPDKWLIIPLFGDLHFGSIYQAGDILDEHTELTLAEENCIAVQLGDLLEAQSSLTHRGRCDRFVPVELPLDVARLGCIQWFRWIGSKMAAFVIGNHDKRSIVTELYNIGEVVVDDILGGFFGFNGLLQVKFSDNHIYKIYLMHSGKGSSVHNDNYPAVRKFAEDNTLDIVVHGHIHKGVSYLGRSNGLLNKDAEPNDPDYLVEKEQLGVLSGGYLLPGNPFENEKDYKGGTPRTPCVILSPTYPKTIIFEKDIVKAMKFVKLLNGER